MRLRGVIVLALALVLAIGAVYLVRTYIATRAAVTAAQTPAVTMQKVVAAAVPLKFGDRLGQENLREVEWPASSLPEGTFPTIGELLQGDPRIVLQPIEANELILATKVTGPGQRASLSAVISSGMRAMTVRVNDVLGVAGFVLPGDRVDLLLTRDSGDGSPITDVLLQNVKVLGIDQRADQQNADPDVVKAVTIEVTTEQAQKVTLATRVGMLSLALRGISNVDLEPVRTVSMRDLNIGEANNTADPKTATAEPAPKPVVTVAPPARPRDPFATVGITRGTQRNEYKVNPEGVVVNPSQAPSAAEEAPAAAPAPAPAAPAGGASLPNPVKPLASSISTMF